MFIKMYNHPFLFYTLIGNHGQSRKSKKPKVNKLKIVLNLNVPIKKHTTSCLRLKKKKKNHHKCCIVRSYQQTTLKE